VFFQNSVPAGQTFGLSQQTSSLPVLAVSHHDNVNVVAGFTYCSPQANATCKALEGGSRGVERDKLEVLALHKLAIL
jgi:hypothetical protein